MSRDSVKNILRDIDALSQEELLALDLQLADRLREQWGREAQAARNEAKRRGIDQVDIDQAIERHRYGR